jgi:hypothetical protein
MAGIVLQTSDELLSYHPLVSEHNVKSIIEFTTIHTIFKLYEIGKDGNVSLWYEKKPIYGNGSRAIIGYACRGNDEMLLARNSSLKLNMERFEKDVNDKLKEGWRLSGAPIFSDIWLYEKVSVPGSAVQAFYREKI